jgi:tetratricopeptide (TPR) repeat protein
VFADRVNEQLVNERKKKWLDLLELENDNLRSALRWSIEHDPLKAVKLIRCMANFWLAGGYLAEGQVWCNSALSRLESYPQDDHVANLARVHGYSVAAMLSNNQGEHHRARVFVEKAIPVYQETGDTKELARSLIVLATAFGFSGDIEQAFKTVRECIKISRENGHKFELAWALSTLSYMTFEFQGPAAAAETDAYMQESLALMQEINHPWGSFSAKEYLSRRAFMQGDIETALKYANEVLADFQEAGATLLATNYKSGIAHALRKIGNLAEAIPMYRETIVVYQDLGHRGAIAHQLENFAFVAIAQEQSQLATKLLGAAEALREISKSRMTPQERAEYDKHLMELRGGLNEEDFTRLWAEGRAMTIEQAIDHALKIPVRL